MGAAKKVKVSLTLSPDLLARIDREAKRGHTTRSYLVEQWLNASAHRAAEHAIEAATIAYYESLTPEQRAEDEAYAAAVSRAASEIDYDAPTPKKRRRRRK